MESTIREAIEVIDRIPGLKEKAEYALNFLKSYAEREDSSKGSDPSQKLQESEERFLSIIENADVGYFFIDKDGIIRDVNTAWARLYKYGSADEIIGRHFADIQKIEDKILANQFVAGIMQADPRFMNGEFSRLCKDGSIGYHSFTARPVSRGKDVIGIEGFIIDTTLRRKAEEELKATNKSLLESERRLMNLYTNMSEGVGLHKMVFDEHGQAVNYRIIGINPQFEKILGLSESDVHDKLATDVYGVAEPPFFKEYLEVVKTGNPFSFEVYFPPMDKHFSISVSPWDRDGFATIFTDITERKIAEEKLLESEAKFRSLAENSPFAILIYQDDVWVYCNSAAEEISGFSAEEIYKQQFWEITDLEYREYVKDIGRRRQKGENVKSSSEFRIITKSGQKKWVFLTGNTTNYGGKPSGIISIVDISDRKKMEFDLQAAMEKAQESDRLKSAFLANMSHEIRTPMNAILGFSDLIGQPDVSGQEQQKYTGIIKNSGKRLLHIIDDIIDLSKLEAQQIEISTAPCNVYELVNTTVESFRNMDLLKQKTQLSLVADLKEIQADVKIETDPLRLQQVLDNLLTNAIKYSSKGTVTMGVRKKPENSQEVLEFFVKDTGKGIPQEKIPIIFERFRQVEENEYHEGAGLGLSICKAFVEMLGGNIQVKSELGKGSEFTFCIPFIQAKTNIELTETGNLKNPINLRGMKILVAEDEEDSYIYLQQLLKETNAKLFRAENGDILMELISEKKPDLILLDINMPGKTGYECLREIREEKYLVKVIAQTAYAMADERKRCLESGCDGYLAKPFNKNALFQSIADAMK
jgi:PAS domain S-box-containing protein